ncbi:MAG: TldD/PmbA family protein [Conexivisphaera sp.]
MDASLHDLVDIAVERALELGADYADARVRSDWGRGVTLRNGTPDPPVSFGAVGIGIRVLVGRSMAFGSTNSLDRGSVLGLVESLARIARSAEPMGSVEGLSREDPSIATWRVPESRRPEDVDPSEMLEEARSMDSAAASAGPEVVGRWISVRVSSEEKYLRTSDGSRITSRVSRAFAFSLLTAKDGSRVIQRTVEIGGSGGWELSGRLDFRGRIAGEAADLVEVLRKAEPADLSGLDAVIVGPEISGIMAHESVGHPFEADRILGREAAQAGESYVGRGDLGARIGSPEAFVSDDPTIPGSYGYYEYDEEGVPARRKRLMVAGVVSELLHDRETAHAFGTRSNGSARSSGYSREPIPRMSNTFVEPGDRTLEELMEEAGRALLMESYMEWNIDDRRENQRYVGLKARLVEGGRPGRLVLNPVLEVTSRKLWSGVVARGRTVEFFPGTCGKGEPMQGVPVWFGGPHMLIRGVVLGRR